jgi:peptide subunit release factor 1 (eRF1)
MNVEWEQILEKNKVVRQVKDEYDQQTNLEDKQNSKQ